MRVKICPIANVPGQPETVVNVQGDVIAVDGARYDLSAINDGDEATPQGDHPFFGPITRRDGEIHCTIFWHYDPATAAAAQPEEMPVIHVSEGNLVDPILRSSVQ